MSEAAFDSCANSTAKVYMKWIEKFAQFCVQAKVQLPEATGAEVSLFLGCLAKSGLAASSRSQASAAISWVAIVAGRSDPCRDRLVMAVIMSVKKHGKEMHKVAPG